MTTQTQYITTPTGRFVGGDVYTARLDKDQQGNAKKNKDQTDRYVYVTLVAIAKNDPEWPAFYAQVLAQDRAAWPQFFDAAGNLTFPNFASKIIDGDGLNNRGERNDRKEGFAGHWIVKCVSGFAPRVVQHDGTKWVDAAPGLVSLGDYIRVQFSTSSNQSQQTPGMYRNLAQVAFVAKGQPIAGQAPDANEAFGAAPPPAPAGYVAPTAPAMPAAPGQAPAAPAAYVPPAAAPAPAAPAAPAYAGYMAPAAAPAAPAPAAPPAPAPAPAGPTMTATATASYESYIAAGWTDEQLVAGGLMLPR